MSENTFHNTNETLRPIYVSAPKGYALSGKIMVSAIVILLVVVVLMICLHVYARWYLLRVRRRHHHRRHRTRRRRASNIVFYVDQSSAAVDTANHGLEAGVRNSLPLFVYSELTHKENLDCAVCLSEFEEGETGRVLPKCHHSFHIECIDMWFHSHSTCPICRAKVEPVDPTRNKDVLITVDKPVQPVPVQPSGSSSREASLADRRRGLDLGGVKIEVPSRIESADEPRPSSPASYGFMSPGNRLQSLKRILSMNKKPVAVSPSAEIGTSCPGGTESDIESRICEEAREQVQIPMPK